MSSLASFSRSLGIMSAITVLALAGCSVPNSSEEDGDGVSTLDELIAMAEAEGELSLVGVGTSFGGDAAVERVVDLMNQTYGTSIRLRQAPGPAQQQLLEQVATENQAGQPASTDLVSGTPFQFSTVDELDFLTTPDWEGISDGAITPELIDQGYAVRIATSVSTILYNTDVIDESEAPDDLQDLLDPAWTGRIASTPYAAGFDVLGAEELYGPAATLEYAEQFSDQVNALVRCGPPAIEQVLSGASPIMALECSGFPGRLAIRDDAPLAQFIPLDAAQKRYQELAVPRNARNPHAAMLLVITLVSPEAQAILWESGGFDNDLIAGSRVAEEVAEAEAAGARFFVPDIAYLLAHPELNETKEAFIDILQRAGIPSVD